ncbi:cytochrome P450 [Mycena leptocephala]|nr:cytochrome P450 [Mycena leptocephala]
MFLKLLASIFGTAGAYVLYGIVWAVYHEFTSPFRLLPGPKSAHWFYGNAKELLDDVRGFCWMIPILIKSPFLCLKYHGLQERWVQKYGRTWKFHRFFGQTGMYTTDLKAIHHFLSNSQIYQKSEDTRFSLGRVVGPGILVVEGDVHKQQRKIMNPAFGAPQVRELTEIFVEKSVQLRDIWAAQAANAGGIARVEVLSWLSKATLDVIGLAGFNYKIDALSATDDAEPNELVEAFEAVFAADTEFSIRRFLQFRYPILRRFSLKQDKVVVEAQATMTRIGRRLLADSKREISENGTFQTGRARDLLALLVRANTSKDLPANQRLSDEDVIAQVPTFLVAGHRTTSTAVTWALFALTQNPTAQARLREELLSVSTDRPTMDELNALSYLDCVVRETLRVYAPVPATTRLAFHDDVVPLGTPLTDTRGKVHESVRVRKGDMVVIPILALNRDVAIWGPDAMEFVPERWEAPPPGASAIPGVWGNMLTFLGGPRSCIGFRFSLVEMKALIFTLVRGLEFELAVPIAEIGKKRNPIVHQPIVVTDRAAGNQLPLLVKPVVR